MTETEIRPSWVSSPESLPPLIFSVYSEDGNRKLSYRRYNSNFYPGDGSKVICTREEVELESLWTPRGEVIGTIFKIGIRRGMPNRGTEKFVYVDAVCEEGVASLQLLHYDSEGNLCAGKIFTGLTRHRNDALAAGHYKIAQLPERIDFQATWNNFLHQVNDADGSIRFVRPPLIPAT